MRAWAYVDRIALDALRPIERKPPPVGPRDVKVRMKAVALNYRDLAIAAGDYHVAVTPPLVPLSDGAGEVVEVGAAVTRVAAGDLVCLNYLPDWIDGPVSPAKARRRLGGPSDGTLREYVVADENDIVRAPVRLTAAEAATLPVSAVTVWHSLFEKAAVRPGETVLVTGSGGVSTSAIQLARAAGARVIAVTRRPEHIDRLAALGAHDVLEATGDWPARAARLCGGVDVALDVAGGDNVGRVLATLRPGAQLHLIGYAAGTATRFDMFEAIRRAVTLHVGSGGSRSSFEALVKAIDLHSLHPAIAAELPVESVREAFGVLERGGHFGKIVLRFD